MKLAIVILVYNEELHIDRCISEAKKISNDIFIIDSYSNDKSIEIIKKHGLHVVQNTFVTHAQQLEFAISCVPHKFDWILRIDADEYLDSNATESINNFAATFDDNCDGVFINRKILFLSKVLNFGGFQKNYILRLFRRSASYVQKRSMDEHIIVQGVTKVLSGNIIDHNLNDLSFWMHKHIGYSKKEAIECLNEKHSTLNTANIVTLRQKFKYLYYRINNPVRPILYFFYRYFLRLGFMDGTVGFYYLLLICIWYRVIVDIEIKRLSERRELN